MNGRPAEFEHAGIRVIGSSIAGAETWIVAPELNLAFDFGCCPPEVLNVDNVFLSHGHMDHAAGLAYYFSQRMFIDNAPGTLYAPEPLLAPIRQLLDLWGEIDGNPPPARLIPAHAGEDIELRRDLLVRPFQVNHPARRRDRTIVQALGYSAIEVRKKLRAQFHDLTGPQLVELKRKGIEIEERLEIPLIAYCGDTAPGDFLALPHVREAKILLLECTFIEPDHQAKARAGNHIHVSQLRGIVPGLRNERIVLTHLTRRTFLGAARDAVRKEVGDNEMGRISFLLEHRRRSGGGQRDARRPAREPNEEADF